MAKPAPKSQDAYLHDMLEAARLIQRYMVGISFDQFCHNSEKRDAVALRISALGESAHKSTRRPRGHCQVSRLKIFVVCVTASLTTTALWISKSCGW